MTTTLFSLRDRLAACGVPDLPDHSNGAWHYQSPANAERIMVVCAIEWLMAWNPLLDLVLHQHAWGDHRAALDDGVAWYRDGEGPTMLQALVNLIEAVKEDDDE